MAGIPDFMVKKPVVVPQTPGEPQNPAKPVPDWMRVPGDVGPQAPPPPPPGALEDIQNVAPSAARTGLEMVPAGPAEMSNMVPMLVRGILSKLNDMGLVVCGDETLAEFDAAYQSTMHPPSGISMDPVEDFGLQSVRENITDPLLGEANPQQAQTMPGKIVQTGLEIGPGILAGPGTLPQKLAMTAGGAGGTEASGAIAEELGATPGWQQAAEIGGGLLGSLSPSIFNRLSNPRPVQPSRQPLVDTLRSRNVPISAGQLSGDQPLMRREMLAGGTAAHEAQPAAFTGAAADIEGGFAGQGARGLTREQMRAELNDMRAGFNRTAAGSTTPFDAGLQDDLLQTTIDYQRNNPLVAPVVEDIMNDLATNAGQNQGILTGQGYQSARSKIGDMVRNPNTDDGVRGALIDMQDALDEAVQRNIADPALAAEFRTLRARYRNFLPIESARAKAGAEEGFISPAALKQSIGATQGKRELATGDSPLTELAEAGAGVLKPPRSSGTAENMRSMLAGLIPASVGAVGGIGSLLHGMDPKQAAMIGAGGLLTAAGLPLARDIATVSDLGQRILSRQGPRIPMDRTELANLLATLRIAQQQAGQPPAMGPPAMGPR